MSPQAGDNAMDRMFELVAGLAVVATWVLVAFQAQVGL
jgi:hypothetical protein